MFPLCFSRKLGERLRGSQGVWGWWAHGKKAAFGVRASFPDSVLAHVHEEQWHHWLGNGDCWDAAGEVISWGQENA